MKLGLVTYLWGKDWDLPTLIENCAQTGFEGVELRTGHAHGVEDSLTPAQRAEVRKRFEDSPVAAVGLGSAFEYHSADPAEVKKNIEGTKRYVVLAHDVGAGGVKVRPNGTAPGVPLERTLEQIGKSLRTCGEFAAGYGMQIRLEVHGPVTSQLPHIQRIMQIADHENVAVCWNCNAADLEGAGLEANFRLVEREIGTVHIHDLYDPAYPYRQLFALLRAANYEGYCLAECSPAADAIRVMHYYRALFDEYQPAG